MSTPSEKLSELLAAAADMKLTDLVQAYQNSLSAGLNAEGPMIFEHHNRMAKIINLIGEIRFGTKPWESAKDEIPF